MMKRRDESSARRRSSWGRSWRLKRQSGGSGKPKSREISKRLWSVSRGLSKKRKKIDRGNGRQRKPKRRSASTWMLKRRGNRRSLQNARRTKPRGRKPKKLSGRSVNQSRGGSASLLKLPGKNNLKKKRSREKSARLRRSGERSAKPRSLRGDSAMKMSSERSNGRNLQALSRVLVVLPFSHYIVPELSSETKFVYSSRKAVSKYKEVKAFAMETVPVLAGPVTYLLLSKGDKSVPKGFDTLSLLDAILPVYKLLLSCGWLETPCLKWKSKHLSGWVGF